jgi:hypothetical protein
MARINMDTSIDIDVDEIYDEMTVQAKKEMAEMLCDDGFMPNYLGDERNCVTTNEYELASLLDKIWDNRLFLNHDDIQNLTFFATKGI